MMFSLIDVFADGGLKTRVIEIWADGAGTRRFVAEAISSKEMRPRSGRIDSHGVGK